MPRRPNFGLAYESMACGREGRLQAMTRQHLNPLFWAEIRRHWEYDPDSPSYLLACRRAGEKYQFNPPTKAGIAKRATSEGWERRGSMVGVNQAALRRADALVNSDGTPVDAPVDGVSSPKRGVESARQAQASNDEAVDKRAEVGARHRIEWQQVGVLRQEALAKRHTDPVEALNRLKVAKITAEITTLQQAGERKAWGMEIMIDPADLSSMSDAQLEAIAAGKTPR